MIAAGQHVGSPTTWTYDVTRGADLPVHEGRRIGLWLLAHGLDPYRAHNPRIVADGRSTTLVVDFAVDLPDGTVSWTRRHVSTPQPPPVPWTAV